jgi:hypothetical protein
MRFLGFIILLFYLLCGYAANGQVVINELMASNTGVMVDPDYDETSDWIELFNAGNQAVNLKGYALTDNPDEPSKWILQTDAIIQAGEFLIIWADGMGHGLHAAFKLSADGESLALYSPAQQLIDSLVFGPQDPNISYGRTPDGGVQWGFFTSPTPGKANTSNAFIDVLKSVPHYSVEGGIYAQAISLTLKSLFGGEVRYTLDGSEPEKHDALALNPISINQTTVVRSRIFKENMVPGPVVTHTYFIDPNNKIGSLPVISISSDPYNFWDTDSGIYVVHSTKPDWEIPINIELFENDGSDRAAFNLPAGAKSTGLYSWQLPQKMLGISFRKEYGASKLEYPLIFDKERKSYDTFTIRASGSDWGNTLFRDGLIQTAAVFNTHLDNSGFRPCVVYINGEFMGIHNIREKIDEDYVVGNYGIEPGSFDMIEEVDGGIHVEVGDNDANTYFISLTAKDLSIQANYDAVAAEMNIEDFTDMVCTEVYSGNSSIGHNLMKWKPKESGKWKWILMDFDRGFSGVNNDLIDFYLRESGWPFRDLMKNEEYKKYFGRKMADLLFTTFNAERMIGEIEDHQHQIEAAIPAHVLRWQGTSGTGNYSNIRAISSFDYWLSEIEKVKTFALARPAVILSDLTNYGFENSLPLTIQTLPANSGEITFNGLTVPVNNCDGAYPANEQIRLVAEAKPGFRFLGWQSSMKSLLIPRESTWKFFDKGTSLGSTWQTIGFNDSGWSSGQAELGYGDDDENTIIGYGPSSENKYITTYFRKNFSISNKDLMQSLAFNLKCDDGAVVYLNGHEIGRYNLPAGTIDYLTNANNSVGGSDESTFSTYSTDPAFLVNGTNVIAVEVHQSSGSSSDVSFDLELLGTGIGTGNFISTQKELEFNMNEAKNIAAVFEANGQCTLPEIINTEYTLSKLCSPFVSNGDITISSSGKLIVEAGVEIYMADGASIIANGPIMILGTENEPVRFKSNPLSRNRKWGAISFINVEDTSRFSNVIIEDASQGKHPVRENASISLFHSNIKLDRITIENVFGNPILARYSDVTLTNSHLHSSITGDLINVKYGKGFIANCTFKGNDQPDTDAIDYDDVENGVIRNCIISGFYGPNSDGVDIGEKARGVLIDSLFVSHISDKGVSVGQQSNVSIRNSVFTACNMGIALKDSCKATIEHCTFYGNNMAVATYEKNRGDAGGNGLVTFSILSNSYEQSFWCDEFSTIDIRHSISDNDPLPDGSNNQLTDPLFNNPTNFDFGLQSASPGTGQIKDLGAGLRTNQLIPDPMITEIAYLTQAEIDLPEFISVYNPAAVTIDLSGYKFTKGVTYTFPEGTTLPPGQKFYVTGNSLAEFWEGRVTHLKNWTSGRLADEGENILLENAGGIPIDGVKYNNKAPWPLPDDATLGLRLKSVNVDNHFGANWEKVSIDIMVAAKELHDDVTNAIYPNPFADRIFIEWEGHNETKAEMLDLTGKLVLSFDLQQGINQIQTESFPAGLYLLKAGKMSQRILKIP